MSQLLHTIISRLGFNTPMKTKVVSNLVWAVGGKIVTLSGNLLVGILVARYLGPEKYGLMNYVISYVTIFQVFASLGLDSIEIREESRSETNRDVIMGTAFRLKLIAAFATMLLIAATTFIAKVDLYTQAMIMVYSLSIVFNTMSVARNYFTSIIWNEYIVKTEITRTLIGAGVKIGLLLMHASLTWFILAMLLDVLMLGSGYAISYNSKIAKVSMWRWDRKTAGYLLKESFPMMLSGTAVIIYTRINQVMIGFMLGNGDVGQFSIATSFVDICIFVPTILSQTISPVLVRTYEQDKEEYKARMHSFYSLTFWLCGLFAIFVSAISYPLIRYSYGTMYLAAVPVLQVLIIRMVGEALSQTSGQAIIIEKIQRYAVIRNVIGCVVCVGLNVLLIPRYGIMGAAVSSAITAVFPGYLAHLFIPAYHSIFKTQTHAILFGWKEILRIKKMVE